MSVWNSPCMYGGHLGPYFYPGVGTGTSPSTTILGPLTCAACGCIVNQSAPTTERANQATDALAQHSEIDGSPQDA